MTRQLADVYVDLERYEEAERFFAIAQDQLPLLVGAGRSALVTRRAEVAYLAGKHNLAEELAAGLEPPYRQWLDRALGDASTSGQRVVLDVPFVHQHEVTCAPATLAAVCSYWSFDVRARGDRRGHLLRRNSATPPTPLGGAARFSRQRVYGDLGGYGSIDRQANTVHAFDNRGWHGAHASRDRVRLAT